MHVLNKRKELSVESGFIVMTSGERHQNVYRFLDVIGKMFATLVEPHNPLPSGNIKESTTYGHDRPRPWPT